MSELQVPRHGDASLADVLPSVLAALGVDGVPNHLGVLPARRACVVLIDCLGWELVRENPVAAPFLNAQPDARPLSAGYPSTTAASLTTLTTGVAPGVHGLVGFAFGIPGRDHGLNVLRWTTAGVAAERLLLEELPPEDIQRQPTLFERARAAGLAVWQVAPANLAGSPLTRASFRGADFRPTFSLGDLEVETTAALHSADRALVYAYHSELDTTGHFRGTGSDAFRVQLRNADRLVEHLAGRLGPDDLLVVTGDHGMVDMDRAAIIDFDRDPDLRSGVKFLGGEARARHVYARPGAESDVLQTWRTRLGADAWVLARDEAIEGGWFGPHVSDEVRGRIGDVVTASRGAVGVGQSSSDGPVARFVGHHGSMTSREQLVPFIAIRG